MSKPSETNLPKLSEGDSREGPIREKTAESRFKTIFHAKDQDIQGGYSTGDPPLPIPNREVKPRHADGTAPVGE